LIPSDLKAIDSATIGENLVYFHDDESGGDLAAKMKEPGFSQIPIKNRTNGNWIGNVTDFARATITE
jgi:predicted transcriptional regulator